MSYLLLGCPLTIFLRLPYIVSNSLLSWGGQLGNAENKFSGRKYCVFMGSYLSMFDDWLIRLRYLDCVLC